MTSQGIAEPFVRYGAESSATAGVRRAVNITLPEALIAAARAADINLSRFFEEQLAARLKVEHIRQWQEENRAAIEHFNARIARSGAWGDDDTRAF